MTNPNLHRLSPVPGLGLEGYIDEITIPAGGKVQCMVSGPPGQAQIRVVRLIHGDPNPMGPGYKESPVQWGQPDKIQVEEQFTDFGSYIEIPHSDVLNPKGPFTLALWVYPTLIGGGWHTLAAKWASGNLSYALYCAGNRFLTAAISRDGITAKWATAREFLQLKCWQFVAFTFDPDSGELSLYQWLKDVPGAIDTKSSDDPLVFAPKRLKPGPVYPGQAPLLFGATPDPANLDRHWAHFNGKIGHPLLLAEALDRDRMWALAQGEEPQHLAPVLGCWDLSQEVNKARVVDLSLHGNHGLAVNAPARAVTGPFWAGMPSRLYTERPQDYNAIHFHEDDLADARWQPTCEVQIPPEARSGIYAVRLQSSHDQLFLPFIVRPPAPRYELAFLVPTLTWQAYGSNRSPYSYTEDGVLDRGLSLYEVHSDGSMVYYRTRRRPTRFWHPSAGFQHWGAHIITADLYLIDWLEAKGLAYDLFAEEDFHQQGSELLAPYRAVILGSHPEYWTQAMMDGLAHYIRQGGRVIYLGGNGLYWVTSIDPERPYLIEVRKGGDSDYGPVFVPEPGQGQHSTTLEVGGPWARRGRPPRSILGVEYAANVFTSAEGRWGFKRLPASYDPHYAFIFEGVEEEIIGDFGLNLGSAVGFEMDAVQEWQWSEMTPKPVVLAQAAHETFFPPRRPPLAPVADMALSALVNGGAVFAASSVTWTGSLSHGQYNNSVSRITENVIRRFLDTPKGEIVVKY